MALLMFLSRTLTIVIVSEDPESELKAGKMSTTSNKAAEEEMDESILDEVDDDMSTGSNADTGENTGQENSAAVALPAPSSKESARDRSGWVASLSHSFMQNVTVGSNDEFTAPTNRANTTNPPISRRATEQQELRGGRLPREYEMVRVARRN